MMLPHLSTHVVVMCLLISCALNNVIANSSNYTKVSACYAPDREALLSVSRAAGFFTNYGYGPWHGDDCCSWNGITCGDANSAGRRRVTEISAFTDASTPNYVMIPTSLCNLSALTSFDLQIGNANVSFPECVGTHLMLLNSFQLRATLDEEVSCNSGRWPQLNIPASFSRLSTLQSLHLDGMRIDSQSLRHIISLPSLVTLGLFSCPLEPSSLPLFAAPHALSNLTSLALTQCCLSGPVPPFTNMPLLQELSLDGNSLSSTLTDFILHSNFSKLEELSLSSNNLSGPLPHIVFKNLTLLKLEENQFSGPFPDIVNSPLLEELYLQNNQFSGPFPDIVNSPLLERIDLSYNHFSGALPESWQHLLSLQDLYLSGNTIEAASTVGTSRRLPEWLFRLPSLSSLVLASTGLQPGDCECQGMLSLLNQTLALLDVSENNLTGPNVLNCIAAFNFTNLPYLSLSSNPLAFDLSSAAMPTDVLAIEMQNCSLFGSIPIQVFIRGNYLLDLSFNGLTGFHGKIHNQSPLCPESIFLSHNLISADISFLDSLHYNSSCVSLISVDPSIFTLDASHNNLTGLIPTSAYTSYSLFSHFNRVLLNNNLIMGISPDLGRAWSTLQTLKLNNNALNGSIPTSILNLTALQLLDLSYNHLEGNFTTLYFSMEQPTVLRVLLLSHNRIQGSIPLSFGALTPDLQVIDLSNNKLSGEIPRHLPLPNFRRASPRPYDQLDTLYEEVRIPVKGVVATYKYELVAMTSLDLSYNHLIGAIPPQIGDFIGLRYLNLSGNMLSGHIPTTLYKLHLLESMDLSCNQLQGKIPSSFSNLQSSLEIFNVSFNEGLEGPIPHGVAFENNMSFIGCPHLCGVPILDACSDHPEESPQPTSGSTEKDKDEKVEHIVFTWMREWIAIPGFILGIIAGFVGTLWILHGKSVSVRALSIMWHVSM